MQVLQSQEGYQRRSAAYAVYIVLLICTGGLAWVFASLFPGSVRWTLRPCSLEQAHFVLNKLVNKRQILSRVYEINLASHKPKRHEGHRTTKVFVMLLTTYQYSATAGIFVVMPSMPQELPLQVLCAKHALSAIDQGAEWSVLNTSACWSRRNRLQLYGQNIMTAGKPNVFSMAFLFLLHPVYIIQYVELAFTMYEQYYYYAGALLSLTLIAGFVSTKELYRKRLQLYNAVAHRHFVPVVQGGIVRGVSSHRLVPGDVVVLLRGKATCDMVLLQGGCLVEESVLSGEAAQVRKNSFVPSQQPGSSGSSAYDPDTHQSCTVFAGTYVQQVWNEDKADEEVLAMVVRTGLGTAMGDMLRQVTSPLIDADTRRDPFIVDLLCYCAVALLLHIAISMLTAVKIGKHPQQTQDTVKRVADVFMAAVPSSIPAVITFSLFRCVVSLKKHHIELHHVPKIKTAAAVDTVVFDKTGTLTGSVPEMYGMVPVKARQFQDLQQDAVQWPNSLKQCAAVCNSLNLVNRQQVAGDVADYMAFRACEARFVERNLVALPLQPPNKASSYITNIRILRRFEFRPQLLRSGVVASTSAGSSGDDLCFFVRGAPGSIEQLLGTSRTPPDYREVIDSLTSQGFRLLALAKGVLRGLSKHDLQQMSQEQLEASVESFSVLGLFVLSNQLRADTAATIRQLQQQAGIRTLMATGDYHLTAIAVAREAGMLLPQGQVITIHKASDTTLTTSHNRHHDATSPGTSSPPRGLSRKVSFACEPQLEAETERYAHQGLVYRAASSRDNHIPAQVDAWQALTSIAQGQAQCCITGPAFEHMLQLGDTLLLETVMRNVVVFSRMKPHQKGQVMDLLGMQGLHKMINGNQRHYPGLGRTCMYCGDGINDLLALAAADVGVAIGAGDVSAAATVSTKHYSIAGCVTVIRESRAAQTLKLAAICYMVICQLSFALAFNVSYFMDGSRPLDRQRYMLDVLALSLGCVCSLRSAPDRLSRNQPRQWLCSMQSAVLLAMVTVMMASIFGTVCYYLTTQPWFTGGTGTGFKNPVSTLCWVVALAEVGGAPILTFHTGTADFCKLTSRPEAIVIATSGILVTLLCALGPATFDCLDVLKLYPFDWHFRIRAGVIFLVVASAWLAVLLVLRLAAQQYKRHRQLGRVASLLTTGTGH